MPETQLAGDIAVHLDRQVDIKDLRSLFSRRGNLFVLRLQVKDSEMLKLRNIVNM